MLPEKILIGVSSKFFKLFRPEEAEIVPDDLIGAEIIDIGAPIGIDVEGGLVIEYKTKAGEKKRLLLEFNELAMWISHI